MRSAPTTKARTSDPLPRLPLDLQHAPGVPKILVGNRLHLAFKRQVPTEQAQAYAERLGVTFFEVSPLCNFNITESFTELARTVLLRHGMDRLWRPSKGRCRRARRARSQGATPVCPREITLTALSRVQGRLQKSAHGQTVRHSQPGGRRHPREAGPRACRDGPPGQRA